MFQKVIIADDLGSINEGVQHILTTYQVPYIKQVQYCDEAYKLIKKAAMDGKPYDLIISDLSFVADHRKQQFASGDDLAATLKKEHPELNIIIYSVEDRFQRVRQLYNDTHVDAFVCKGREGISDLKEAITTVFNGERYVSPRVAMAMSDNEDLQIDEYDITLMRLLSYGYSHDEISKELVALNESPSSLSAIEKKMSKLKIQFRANNAVHLVALVKDLGII
ncbi:response regulator [uncultured Dokdonia sp.]|uniref:response regulator n=1 Tax=Dokdonia sp. R78006 TaxID=3093866 RepID=UPI00261E7A51|nr:response regulator [uncultured Dokdonia sp.]